MTKKDYVKIAETLAANRPVAFPAAIGAWEKLVRDMADMLKADNSRFDRERFTLACGLIGG